MNKKGFVLTLDITIALILIIIIIVVSSFYINQAKGPSLSKLLLIKRGSDILLQLDNQGVLDTINEDKIGINLTNILPFGNDMRIYLNGTGTFPNVSAGTFPKSIGQIGSGKMIFVLSDGKIVNGYYTARYFIWTR